MAASMPDAFLNEIQRVSDAKRELEQPVFNEG